MKLGFGLYAHMIDDRHLRFARQCGATHAVIHLTDYFHDPEAGRGEDDQPVERESGFWGVAGANADLWSVDALKRVKHQVEAAGLAWHAVENLDPAFWHDILLDGPEKEAQFERVAGLIRNLGEAGIPVLGYNFSLAGVHGRVKKPFARGGAVSVGMEGRVDPTPLPEGVVWNMFYDTGRSGENKRSQVSAETLWQRLQEFLERLLPVAEEAGVTLAAHPDDPPVDALRNTPRLVNRAERFQELLDRRPSPRNQLEYCVGTLAEMPGSDVYAATEQYAAQGKIAYVHLRNVIGEAPHYREVFIDEGDIDVERVLRILAEHDFDGVIIPDHTPLMDCDAPWHAGMAYAMGYLNAAMRAARAETAPKV